jgi:four helix bundle suffix protein
LCLSPFTLFARITPATEPAKATYETFQKNRAFQSGDCCKLMIGLFKLTNFLLDQQLRQLEKPFVEEGGLRERMTRARLTERAKQNRADPCSAAWDSGPVERVATKN